jgi:hypothetical protein
MIGRRAVVGLSLLSALLFCAFGAQSASAAKGTNTTAFTCVKGGGNLDFTDPHCDNRVEPKKGEYGHVEIAKDTTTAITATNEKTKEKTTEHTTAVLKGELFKVKLEITCTKLHAKGTLHNVEPVSKEHSVTGEIETVFSECTVHKPTPCTLKEVKVPAVAEGVEGLGAEKNTMGLEFKPTKGEIFVSFELEGASCPLKGVPIEVKGTAIATGTPSPSGKHTGATAIFTNEMTKETLTIGGKPAEFSAVATVQMEGGNPIALTTAT